VVDFDIDTKWGAISTLAGSIEAGCAASDDLDSLKQQTTDLSAVLQQLDGSLDLPLNQLYKSHRHCWT
jgi:hypothetical protein